MKIGDAFERTIQMQAANVPDVLLPDMQIESLLLFHSYSDDPLLQEKHSDTWVGLTYAYRMEEETLWKKRPSSLPKRERQRSPKKILLV
jgi:hypothetical protein